MKFTARIRVAAIAVVAVTGLALGGCSGTTERPAETGSTDDILRLSVGSPPSSFAIGNLSGNDAMITLSLFDTLLLTSTDGQIGPGLAESWEYSDDRTELTLHLRDGQEFTDGTPVDGEAVAASLEVSRAGAGTAAAFSSVESIAVADDTTVVISLSAPDASLVPVLATFNGALGATASLDAEDAQLEPVGSGPYILDDEQTTVGSVYTLTKNPDHWNADAYPFETVEFSVIADPTAVQNALQSGQLDYAGVSSESIAAQFDSSKFTSGTNIPSSMSSLWLIDREGAVVPALGDVRVRQAINLAIDRSGIAAAINPGTNTATNQVYNPRGEAFSEEILNADDFNVEKAKDLMADAGYEDGFDVTMPSTFVSTPYESVLAQALGDIGIRVTWEAVPFQEFFAKVLGRNYGMYFMVNGLSATDAGDTNAVLRGVFNAFETATPELDALLKTANAATDEEAGAAFRAINEYFVEEAWFAPVSVIGGYYVHSNDVDYTSPAVPQQSVRPFAPAAD
ncbi:ABC transporter substrate-binding protein [Microbacterium sp. zg.Y625]|uniref:ABC transporter substrate-binding protein n=1 Tax=Microbacterium jiangjiandongii TaxID=3049071 RepID=UPI00214BE1F5|nr:MULTISPECIES: ABC transporter substrate-binding protein [unclassified Microbacterium]MCR2792746.1 ABC transporter substrate-binding protein [Microbacterium sp. zg.Y625]WIM26724.1 ABC transporter substrate-binding protein [Microbacterium sp. zg-Y625]